ncbi:BON domain-containing protein [Noviherbaspirillum sedimenti]|uniref:Osmotically-inducible protein Y n=2 Tax=Noviherbaspirillum sedimenti TaxID=2320865 RepID=A0A3A3G8K1_9BURK|nr:BON domain-containing protein [Noviherbaspirillum sedimenti]
MSSGASESSSASGSYGNGSLTQRAERGIEDSVITTKAKTALLADTTVKGTDIHVETNKGVVSLSGMVDTERQRERAASIVKGIDGVSSVDNKMTVKQ